VLAGAPSRSLLPLQSTNSPTTAAAAAAAAATYALVAGLTAALAIYGASTVQCQVVLCGLWETITMFEDVCGMVGEGSGNIPLIVLCPGGMLAST